VGRTAILAGGRGWHRFLIPGAQSMPEKVNPGDRTDPFPPDPRGGTGALTASRPPAGVHDPAATGLYSCTKLRNPPASHVTSRHSLTLLRLTSRNPGKKIRHARHSLTALGLTSHHGLRIRRADGFRRGLPVPGGAVTAGVSGPIRIRRQRGRGLPAALSPDPGGLRAGPFRRSRGPRSHCGWGHPATCRGGSRRGRRGRPAREPGTIPG